MSRKKGVITLIPKKNKARELPKNWSPITLLNLDYKLVTRALAQRITKSLPEIIHKNQTSFVQGRFIGYNIRKIKECIQYLNTNNENGLIITIDYEKAFDSID